MCGCECVNEKNTKVWTHHCVPDGDVLAQLEALNHEITRQQLKGGGAGEERGERMAGYREGKVRETEEKMPQGRGRRQQ